jgi:hypothetical protein
MTVAAAGFRCRTRTGTCADQYGSERGSNKFTNCDMTTSEERKVLKGIAENNKCMAKRNNNGTIELCDPRMHTVVPFAHARGILPARLVRVHPRESRRPPQS